MRRVYLAYLGVPFRPGLCSIDSISKIVGDDQKGTQGTQGTHPTRRGTLKDYNYKKKRHLLVSKPLLIRHLSEYKPVPERRRSLPYASARGFNGGKPSVFRHFAGLWAVKKEIKKYSLQSVQAVPILGGKRLPILAGKGLAAMMAKGLPEVQPIEHLMGETRKIVVSNRYSVYQCSVVAVLRHVPRRSSLRGASSASSGHVRGIGRTIPPPVRVPVRPRPLPRRLPVLGPRVPVPSPDLVKVASRSGGGGRVPSRRISGGTEYQSRLQNSRLGFSHG